MKGGQLARRIQHEHLAFRMAAAGQGNRGGIESRMAHEFGVRAKCETANDGMQSVRSDDQVEATPGRMLEGDVYACFILSKGLDGVSEDVIRAILARVVQDSGEVPSRQLHISRDDR